MPRKFFRKWIPSHDALMANRHVARLGPRLRHHNLWHFNRRSVAGGVAAGLFAGLIPGSNPVQFTTGALLAIAGRVNLPIAVFVTLYSNPFTIVPLYFCAFQLGQLALFHRGEAPASLVPDLSGKGFGEWMPAVLEWMASAGKPLLLGIPLLALLLAVIGYFAVDWAWRLQVRCAWAARKRRRGKDGRSGDREIGRSKNQ
jgi:uncharacterized protein (DUF2062 family)